MVKGGNGLKSLEAENMELWVGTVQSEHHVYKTRLTDKVMMPEVQPWIWASSIRWRTLLEWKLIYVQDK